MFIILPLKANDFDSGAFWSCCRLGQKPTT